MDSNEIYSIVKELIETKFITREEAIYYAEEFYKQGKISKEQHDKLIELINNTY